MRLGDRTVNHWLEQDHTAMIHCPYQPRRLILSRETHRKRHLASQLEPPEVNMKTDLFRHAF